MLATLRRVRLATGIASALLFAIFTVSQLGSIMFSGGRDGFLGTRGWLVFLIATVLLAVTVLSIPFLRARQSTRDN